MAEIVNLRAARKARARQEAGAKASANAAKFGRSKAERAREAQEFARATAALDGARREGKEGSNDAEDGAP